MLLDVQPVSDQEREERRAKIETINAELTLRWVRMMMMIRTILLYHRSSSLNNDNFVFSGKRSDGMPMRPHDGQSSMTITVASITFTRIQVGPHDRHPGQFLPIEIIQRYIHTLNLTHITGESSWDPPAAMQYRPPVGRDRDGNKVDVKDVTRTWQTRADNWGTPFYENLITNEVVWEKPPVCDLP